MDPGAKQNLGLQTILERERVLLAPYAMHSADTCGRRYQEPKHPYRGPFQRDRDRVVHSAAYRRLSGKMQVFTGDMGDYHRTRLTHTLEVASIARTIGRALRLNEDLVEALALFHDIGHPPFGHAGEEALHDCLADQGGFSHNRYALTIAEEIEIRYQRFPGLNLTREVLDGQAMRVDKDIEGQHPLLEVQVVDMADSITYDAHDTDDAVKLGLVTLDELERVPLIRATVHRVHQRLGALDRALMRKAVVHELIDWQVSDLLDTAGRFLAEHPFASADQARRSRFRLAQSPPLLSEKGELEQFLYQRVYRHPRLVSMRSEAQNRIKTLFRLLCRDVDLLPNKYLRRATKVGIPRSVGDYLAGMTDRFFDHQLERFSARRVVG